MAEDTAHLTPARKNMDRWLGDGGMGIIGGIGASIDAYGVVEASYRDHGWAAGRWLPTMLASNPHGIVQAGVHAVIHDALMNFAINSALSGKDRTRATLEMKTETMKVAQVGEAFTLRGDVIRMAKLVAYAEARVIDSGGELVSRATGTFLLLRE
jgi:acyl-coenzyme A thioesterase PaaI-like protein